MSRIAFGTALVLASFVCLASGCAANPTESRIDSARAMPAAPAFDGTDTTCRSGFTVPGGRSC